MAGSNQTDDRAHGNAQLRFDERIYEASPQSLLYVVSELPDEIDSAMLVGHNPGIEGFIGLLTGESERMPTAALAVIDLEIDEWRNAAVGVGILGEVIRPRDEMK